MRSVVASVRRGIDRRRGIRTDREIQLRDIALAVSILLAEQKLNDYGFSDRLLRGTRPGYETQLFAYNRYYFRDDDARKRAFAKWTEWSRRAQSITVGS